MEKTIKNLKAELDFSNEQLSIFNSQLILVQKRLKLKDEQFVQVNQDLLDLQEVHDRFIKANQEKLDLIEVNDQLIQANQEILDLKEVNEELTKNIKLLKEFSAALEQQMLVKFAIQEEVILERSKYANKFFDETKEGEEEQNV